MADVTEKETQAVPKRQFHRIAFKGHGPRRLGGFKTRYVQRSEDYIRYWLERYATEETVVMVGMNMGVDQIVAKVCAQMDIKFEAYLPQRSFGEGWHPYPQAKFAELMAEASACVYTSEHVQERNIDDLDSDMETCPYTGDLRTVHPESFRELHLRHTQGLIDQADLLIAIWDGSKGSYTGETVEYAVENTSVPIVHFNPYKDKVVGILNKGGA
ncbi:MAG: hypothetical protein Tp1123DCM257201_45 [Prokaryotic dsDNA virus sp.]|nr:MAG: hypothetical protein Tp1123DCM257201_45 [Prokaryotic dsDNA virus sp.]|tara:strand:+ start:6836 stop:7477 length:642 start_codon:yes stop_codon:yes gene_type:complete